MEDKKKELLKPKYDVVFHSLFRVGNEDITKAIPCLCGSTNCKGYLNCFLII